MIDGRLRDEGEIGQLGFMQGSGTANGIFGLRQLMEKFREKQGDLRIDLENTYDRFLRQEVWRSLREKMVPEKYVRLIKKK